MVWKIPGDLTDTSLRKQQLQWLPEVMPVKWLWILKKGTNENLNGWRKREELIELDRIERSEDSFKVSTTILKYCILLMM